VRLRCQSHDRARPVLTDDPRASPAPRPYSTGTLNYMVGDPRTPSPSPPPSVFTITLLTPVSQGPPQAVLADDWTSSGLLRMFHTMLGLGLGLPSLCLHSAYTLGA